LAAAAAAWLLLLASAAPAMADDHVWVGGASDLWSDDANWNPGKPDAAGDTVVLDGTTVRMSVDVDEAAPTDLKIRVDAGFDDHITFDGLGLEISGDPAIDLSGGGHDAWLTIWNPLTLTGDSSFTGGIVFPSQIKRSVANGGFDLTINGGDWEVNAYSGTGGFVVDGGLTGIGFNPFTHTGDTTINNTAYVYLYLLGRLPDAGDVTVNAGGVLDLSGHSDAIDELSGAGHVYTNGGTLTVGSAGGSSTFSGSIRDSGGLTKTGDGTFTISGFNFYTGATKVQAGTLRLGAADRISNSSDVSVAAGATLDLNGNDETVATVTGAGNVSLGGGRLTLGDATDFTFSGSLGGGDITKQGAGTMALDAGGTINTNDDVNVSDGELHLDGTLNAWDIWVLGGAALSGEGTIGGISGRLLVAGTGVVSPGASAGRLTANVLAMLAGSVYACELNGTAAGAQHDQLDINAAVDVTGATLDLSLGYAPAAGDSYTIIDNGGAGAVTGAFDGLAEGAGFTEGGYRFEITYAGGDGNDVVVTCLGAVPGGGGGDDGGGGGEADDGQEPSPDPPAESPFAGGGGAVSASGAGADPSAAGLSWSAVDGADRYAVYRALCPTCPRERVAVTRGTGYQDDGALPGLRYFYWVRAGNAGGWADFGGFLSAWRYDQSSGILGDFNGDGVSDLMWWENDVLYIWYFAQGQVVGVSPEGRALDIEDWLIQAVGDLDGDGIADLLWRNPETGETLIWLLTDQVQAAASSSAGEGWLVKESLSPGAAEGELLPTCADVNGDDVRDLAWRDLGDGSLTCWLMAGGRPLLQGPPALAEGARLRARGGADLLSGTITRRDAAPSGEAPWPGASGDWLLLCGPDLDADGKADLLWWSLPDNRVVGWLMDGVGVTGGWELRPGSWQGWVLAEAADLDDDGAADLVWRRPADGTLRAWLLDPAGGVAESRTLAEAPGGLWLVKGAGDFDGDGDSEVYLLHAETGQARLAGLDGARELAAQR
jgi:autotransporter-associated beta strand protein